ncbi:hypothetical protein [Ruminococcus sp.]|uniref:hypothetical protein n=1 Tax=Ruminococcus sp. TaxID=41978 RepID=UPI00386712D4
MTYIEFFDINAVENICSCLVSAPERVILIGDNKKILQLHAQRYHSLFQKRGMNIEFIYKTVNKNNLNSIVELLSEIVEKYEDCVFDLSGGEDLMLVAVGIICYRYRDKDIQLSRINLRTGVLYDCDEDGVFIPTEHYPMLTVDENIRIFGGKVVYEDERGGATRRWDFNDGFMQDIAAMWQICRKNVGDWNAQMDTFAATDIVSPSRIVSDLIKKGLIKGEKQENGCLKINYKNDQIKQCLTKAGQALEMYITMKAMQATDKDGDLIYNDVCNGVFIDWDGVIHREDGESDTENEIDVMMMHGMIPVFVSCKNGVVTMDELYKLDTVASRFGGKYAKKVLVANALGDTAFAAHFRQRAKDMRIKLIENVQNMKEKEIDKAIGLLWCT